MTKEEAQRQELLSFIKWKMIDEEYQQWYPEIKDLNLMALTRWAIRHDIIDAQGLTNPFNYVILQL